MKKLEKLLLSNDLTSQKKAFLVLCRMHYLTSSLLSSCVVVLVVGWSSIQKNTTTLFPQLNSVLLCTIAIVGHLSSHLYITMPVEYQGRFSIVSCKALLPLQTIDRYFLPFRSKAGKAKAEQIRKKR
ncbi:hypothetical protein BU24DRAFT_254279 [Aaosphaeria arxii CBS 175.79]|uniref:Uncharacterized protein n=1 Tax=Aaosphaeria arxii CBS 175.79 TaxID=1450172 RepID=A0A6A5XI60_9PLEO|nr:uncharacterized protein BU24DRAFT_254279 [Aaosphaeria arxii CBS 175.79]KAF2012556.1 hypothetical protein BU24DRAFT_254279 [Aaosphaeria arxii CBS 175.79]